MLRVTTRNARAFSQKITPQTPSPSVVNVHDPYVVRRNSRGSLPVYSHTRNAGSRLLVEIRNIEGKVHYLAADLQRSLFPHDSPEAARMNVQIRHQRHLVLRGGRWRRQVVEWLAAKGF